MEEESLVVYWPVNAYSAISREVFRSYILTTESDVTLVFTDAQQIKAHRLVLAAASPLLRQIFCSMPVGHLNVTLAQFDYSHMTALVTFIYKGFTTVDKAKKCF